MYGTGFRAKDMDPVHASLAGYPDPDASIPLLPPDAL